MNLGRSFKAGNADDIKRCRRVATVKSDRRGDSIVATRRGELLAAPAQAINDLPKVTRPYGTMKAEQLHIASPLIISVESLILSPFSLSFKSTTSCGLHANSQRAVIFADSSWAVPGATEILAPHLVLEVLDLPPARGPPLVVSTTRIPFDQLRTGSRDLLLVTISNLGSQAGRVEVYMPACSYALLPAPGAQLNLDGNNRATIPAGGHLTFGVTFQPMEAGPEEAQLLIVNTTIPPGKVVSRIQLDGLGVPDETGGVPPIVAPITPPREFIPGASRASWITKPGAMPWLFGSLLLVSLLAFTRSKSRRRSKK